MALGGIETAAADPAEEVARIAAARRPWLLRLHRRRLRFEDLEDCYSQATLELVARARRSPFDGPAHVENALQLRFRSRIDDRIRALEGRSAIEAAIARAVPVDAPGTGAGELEDRAATVERQVFARTEMQRLREVIADLSRDQQLVLASQVLLDMEAAEFCRRHGWSVEKYRKVAQRARGRLRLLVAEYERGGRCRRLEPDLLALCAGVADGEALARARAHLANCPTCTRMVVDLERSARSVAALLPLPVAAGGLGARLSGLWATVRRVAGVARHPLAEAGTPGGAGVAGGSLASAGALKVGIAAVCVAGAAGGYAACSHLGVLRVLGLGRPQIHHTAAVPHRRTAVRRARRRDRLTAVRVVRHRAPRAARRDPAHSTVSSTFVAAPSTPARAAATATAPARVVHTLAPAAAAAPRRRRRRLTAIAQIRLEFGTAPARVASWGVASTRASAASRSAIAQIRREFGTPPPGRTAAAAAAPVAAPAGASAATAPAASAAPAPPQQSSSQVAQTQAEFGLEK